MLVANKMHYAKMRYWRCLIWEEVVGGGGGTPLYKP